MIKFEAIKNTYPDTERYLDHGFIALVDTMGSDEEISNAARISYGGNEKERTEEEDRNLIRYLYRNRHTSPFEMAEVKFLLKIPIFVMRQLVRHRTACLTGDTILDFDLGESTKNNTLDRSGRYKITVKDFYDQWWFGAFGNMIEDYDLSFIDPEKYYSAYNVGDWFLNRKSIADSLKIDKKMKAKNRKIIHYKGSDILSFYEHQKNDRKNYHRDLLKQMTIRSLNEDTKEVYYTHITDIWKTGEKPVYEICIGKQNQYQRKIKASEDHLFFTERGWKKLKDINVDDKIWSASSHESIESNYQEPEIDNDEIGDAQDNANDSINYGTRTYLDGKLSTVQSKEYVGIEETYDLEVSGPYHNFSANSFIVHNSLNEYSARYSVVDDEFYLPEISDLQFQSRLNKQMSAGELPPEEGLEVQKLMKARAEFAFEDYNLFLNDYKLSREMARINLPLSSYTELYWKIDLHNFFHFVKLRNAPKHAQSQIVTLAKLMYEKVKAKFPLSCEAFEDYHLNSVTFSRQEHEILKKFLKSNIISNSFFSYEANNSNLSKREIDEFFEKLDLARC